MLTDYLQHYCRIRSDFEMRRHSHESSTINFRHFYRAVVERLSDMGPDRFYPATVGAPWRVKLYEPHAIIANIDEFVT